MDLRLAKIELKITSFTDGPGQVEDAHLCFKRQAKTCTKIGVIHVGILAFIPSPAPVGKTIKIGVLPYQVSKLSGAHYKMRQILALLIETTQQFVPADLEQFIAENICTLKHPAIDAYLDRGAVLTSQR